jgi:beta-galactosidase/beta-glucuronidase
LDSDADDYRIWGGGIYEEDIFYDICDELGILVWQDFMYGCGNYPTFPELLQSMRVEATANVRRIRHHPSIVIFAGNNEDYQVQESCGLTYNYEDKDPESWLKTDFPARFIYEKVGDYPKHDDYVHELTYAFSFYPKSCRRRHPASPIILEVRGETV